MKKIFITGILGLFLTLTMNLEAKIITRAAMDVGSAQTKLTVADVDSETQKIITTWYENSKNIELRHDVSTNGSLSSEIEEKLIQTLMEFKKDCQPYAPQEWTCVGTAVFRKAKNGQEFLDRVKEKTGINVLLIPQQEEAEIGFHTAVASSGLDPQTVISWDSGAGSFQISGLKEGQIEMYGAEFGFVPALEALLQNRGQTLTMETPNPLNLEEVYKLIGCIQEKLPEVPQWLKENNKQIVSVGPTTCIFNIGSIATESTSYSKEQVWKAILSLCGKNDEELKHYPEPRKTMVALVLLYSVMDHCKIEKISYVKVNGGCNGILIMPKYWQDI